MVIKLQQKRTKEGDKKRPRKKPKQLRKQQQEHIYQ